MSLSQTQKEKWELGVALILHYWPALSTAVASGWGGPDSKEKRDWLAGAVADMVFDRPETDQMDIEEVLLQVMRDEFEVEVEDGSEEVTAKRIFLLKDQVLRNDFSTVDTLHQTFIAKGGKEIAPPLQTVEAADDDDDEDEDMDMDDAPAPTLELNNPARLERVVDEDGFELVQKRRGKR